MSVRALSFLAAGAVLLIAGCSGGGSDPVPSSAAAPPPSVVATQSSAAPSSTAPPTTSTRSSPTDDAVRRYETFLHAVGREDLATACEIAAPAAKKAEDEGLGPCEQTFPITFQMISAAQKTALKSAVVDRTGIKVDSAKKVEIPARAVVAAVRFTDEDLGDAVLEYQGGQWYVTD
ncbi:hypothetical protein FPZ12_042395 [Amycolatopsis acidicola]|uniref:DUF4878 domain-containing protein n=1 Tax=Amycolatopsis acidicola TaxID=2596893 RepID=A0A5N0UM82_9PSEU|nr:hypothetical protein [Amycolatopsis acidicola]KAA9149867.1 hypothetical protein FPZ12_042395 [Amycolatopsis acidicola]